MGLADGMADTANVLRTAAANAASLEESNRQLGQEAGALDVYSHTFDGLSDRMQTLPGDLAQAAREGKTPGQISGEYYAGLGRSTVEGLMRGENAHGFDAAVGSFEGQVNGILSQGQQLLGLGDQTGPEGALQTVGAVFGLLTSIEQLISTPLAMIPFPAFPAVRITDMDIGLPHAHSHPPNLIPPAPPVPLPSTGPVIPIPFLSGAIRTLINGLPAARCGDMGLGIWCGGYFPMYEIFLGSSNVWIEGARAARLGVDITRHCIFTTPRPQDPPIGPMIGFTITGSHNVLIGGVPMPSLLGFAMGAALKGLFRGAARVARRLQATQAAQRLSTRLHRAANRALSRMGISNVSRLRNRVHRAVCTVTGHPVDVATGKVFTETVDVELGGAFPIKLERTWYSTSTYRGPLGHGWHHSFDLALVSDRRTGIVAVRLDDGRSVLFPYLEEGTEYLDRANKLLLRRDPNGWTLRTADQVVYRFAPRTPADDFSILVEIKDMEENRIFLEYDQAGLLVAVVDAAGRRLVFESDSKNRINRVLGTDPTNPQRILALMNYRYDERGNLIEARDALGNSAGYSYEGHLLVREANRNDLGFHFAYDGEGADARCIRTWGDGGIYDHRLEYQEEGRLCRVTDSVGHQRVYECDPHMGVVKALIDANGERQEWRYNAFGEKVEETDALGNTTRYVYDARGNVTSVTWPDGVGVQIEYDDWGRRTRVVDRVGGVWTWSYDEDGRLVQRSNSEKETTTYEYRKGRLTRITDPSGASADIEYDSAGNVAAIHSSEGRSRYFEYDGWGRRVSYREANGSSEYWVYDLKNRPVEVVEPDGNKRSLEYDGEGNVIRLSDDRRNLRYQYFGLGLVASREEAGARFHFEYDTEGRLIGISNPFGKWYRFDLDAEGRIRTETAFDGLKREYDRDAAGRVRRLRINGRLKASYQFDVCGRLTRIEFADGSYQAFEYRPDGALMAAENEAVSVRFERDRVGRVTGERQNDEWISVELDATGLRRRMTSSRKVEQLIQRDAVGNAKSIIFKTPSNTGSAPIVWNAEVQRDILGREIERRCRGDVHFRWERDEAGRPLSQTVSIGRSSLRGGDSSNLFYKWDKARLVEVGDSLKGTRRFGYDERGVLSRAELETGRTQWRQLDAFNNVFESPDMSDREYGEAGQLLVARTPEGTDVRYEYDDQGNVVRKMSSTGGPWHFEWNEAGMLSAVQRPDGRTVSFTYDALGRRIRRVTSDRWVRWIWDGDRPVHEVREDRADQSSGARGGSPGKAASSLETSKADLGRVVSWLFEPEGLTPLAKVCDDESQSVLSDFSGAPIAMFGANGRQVWSCNRDLFGRLVSMQGDSNACRFRDLGQQEDEEVQLYYNRYRYYDPLTGVYLSRDPISYNGGLNLYAYVEDPLQWADPLGLSRSGGGCSTLTAAEREALQRVASKHKTTLYVYGSRARGEGRNIHSNLPVGKGPGTRSDIDVRFDGDLDIATGGRLSDDLANIVDGHGNKLTDSRPLIGPPPDPVIVISPE